MLLFKHFISMHGRGSCSGGWNSCTRSYAVEASLRYVFEHTERSSRTRLLMYPFGLPSQPETSFTLADPSQDRDQPLLLVSDGFLDLTGYSRTDVLMRNCRFLQGMTIRMLKFGLPDAHPFVPRQVRARLCMRFRGFDKLAKTVAMSQNCF